MFHLTNKKNMRFTLIILAVFIILTCTACSSSGTEESGASSKSDINNSSSSSENTQSRTEPATGPNAELIQSIWDGEKTVTFGEYNWIVLAVEDDKALLLSEECIDSAYWHTKDGVTAKWEGCTLQKWLNGTFSLAFSDDEKNAIYKLENDNFFLLSLEEAETYFADDTARIAKWGDRDNPWWLRTPGSNTQYDVMYIAADGSIKKSGFSASYVKLGVRPAVWITWE